MEFFGSIPIAPKKRKVDCGNDDENDAAADAGKKIPPTVPLFPILPNRSSSRKEPADHEYRPLTTASSAVQQGRGLADDA